MTMHRSDAPTSRQLARLRTLGIAHDPATITATGAAEHIAAAEALLPPTPTALECAKAKRVDVSGVRTRGELATLVESTIDGQARAMLAASGADLKIDAGEADVDEALEAWESWTASVEFAREVGVEPIAPKRWAVEELAEMTSALDNYTSSVSDLRRIATGTEIPALTSRQTSARALAEMANALSEFLSAIERLAHAGFQPPPVARWTSAELREYAEQAEAFADRLPTRDECEHLHDNGRIQRIPSHSEISAVLAAFWERMRREDARSADTLDNPLWMARRAVKDAGTRQAIARPPASVPPRTPSAARAPASVDVS